jgi:hypothetical protein
MVLQCLASTADTLDDIATVLDHVPAPEGIDLPEGGR